MSKLKFFHSSMRAGKSTLALQMFENFTRIEEPTILCSTIDNKVESRIGLKEDAYQLYNDVSIQKLKSSFDMLSVENIIIDEAQFLPQEIVEELAHIVDSYGVNVYCFGLLTDYRGKLFNGSKNLIELSDEIEEIQSRSLCWCGKKGTHNMRIDDKGFPLIEGDVVGIGEGYEVLCRKHFSEQTTKQVARIIKEE